VDKNIWAVTAHDKTISPSISEPFNAAEHLVFFQRSSVHFCIHEELHNVSWDKPYKTLRANRTTSRLAAAVPWFRYLSFKAAKLPFRSGYSPDPTPVLALTGQSIGTRYGIKLISFSPSLARPASKLLLKGAFYSLPPVAESAVATLTRSDT
jgi:hypothetical protein